ncbi:hypothetical protein DPMN_081314 [Dreissena polymorpha]|uniref:Uncharacterized protein n=1 Tax=Dreissena polymorpha TaxID=45954 RepID=A0A9D3Y5S1_DREPO|nr:hypothetical protein DPMN_081314 [Dreissena polymorpha]
MERVDLEVHRPFCLPTQEESHVSVAMATSRVSDETGSQSVQVFTLFGDTTSIVDSTMVIYFTKTNAIKYECT